MAYAWGMEARVSPCVSACMTHCVPHTHRCSSLDDMKRIAAQFPERLTDPAYFRSLYGYAFGFALADAQRSLPCDVACAMWRILLNGRYGRLEEWLNFVEVRSRSCQQMLPLVYGNVGVGERDGVPDPC